MSLRASTFRRRPSALLRGAARRDTSELSRRHARGQAMVEYAGLSTLLLFAALTMGVVTPVGKIFVDALQQYVDLFFYALNVAVG